MRLVVLVTVGLLAVVATFAAPPPKNTLVGTPICVRCHLDFAHQWEALPHSKAMLSDKVPTEAKGCEACHGPGGQHVAGNRKVIGHWEQCDTDARNQICLQCHQGKVEAKLWAADVHSTVLSCDQCHEVHQPVKQEHLLRKEPGPTCAECHADLDQKIKAKQHHILADGALTCDMCHAFHGSTNSHLLTQPQGELCKGCHDPVPQPDTHKRKDWKLHHGADAKGHQAECTKCHDEQTFCNRCHAVPIPHPAEFATNHAALAKQRQETCLQCHEKDFCKLCHADVPVQ